MLTKERGEVLVKIARKAIEGEPFSPKDGFLKEKRGVFVTLTKNGELRGCIGLPYPVKSLGAGVIEAAKDAAYKDSRFPPLHEDELSEIEIEVSVLSIPKPCELRDIKTGDGVILEAAGRSALFLPQVWEQLPTKKAFLEQLSMKAFLPPSAYKTAGYKKFSVQIFK